MPSHLLLRDLMLEMGILIAAVAVLGITISVLRRNRARVMASDDTQ